VPLSLEVSSWRVLKFFRALDQPCFVQRLSTPSARALHVLFVLDLLLLFTGNPVFVFFLSLSSRRRLEYSSLYLVFMSSMSASSSAGQRRSQSSGSSYHLKVRASLVQSNAISSSSVGACSCLHTAASALLKSSESTCLRSSLKLRIQ